MTTYGPNRRRPHPRRFPRPRPAARGSRLFTAALTGVLASAALGTGLLSSAPAYAATAQVNVSSRVLSGNGASTISLAGSGFQSIKGGFGGIYVLFGYASANWRPSQGGVSGSDLVYVPDSETKQNAGHQRFVAFPGSATGTEANGGVIAANGTWQTTLTVPGPTFAAIGPDGSSRTINCRTVRCGVITIGAHGVKNPQNETFTPITFAAAPAPAPVKTTAPTSRPTAAPPSRAVAATPPAGQTMTPPMASHPNATNTAGAKASTSSRVAARPTTAKPSSGASKASSSSASAVTLGTDGPGSSAAGGGSSTENTQPVSANHDTHSGATGWWIGLVAGLGAALAAAATFWIRRSQLGKRS